MSFSTPTNASNLYERFQVRVPVFFGYMVANEAFLLHPRPGHCFKHTAPGTSVKVSRIESIKTKKIKGPLKMLPR